MIKFLRHRMKFHKLSRWHEVINQLLHLWNSRSNYPKNAEGEPKYEKSKNSCHIWQKSRVQAHAGSFAQNSFQTNSINSCTTSKKLQFWLKIVLNFFFLTKKQCTLSAKDRGATESPVKWFGTKFEQNCTLEVFCCLSAFSCCWLE